MSKKKNNKSKAKKKSKAQPSALAPNSKHALESRPISEARNSLYTSHQTVPGNENNRFEFSIAVGSPNVDSSQATPSPSNITACDGHNPRNTQADANLKYHRDLLAAFEEAEQKVGNKIENHLHQPILGGGGYGPHHSGIKSDHLMKGCDKRTLASRRRATATSVRDEFGIDPENAPISVDPHLRDEDMPSAFYVRPKRDMEGDPTTWNFRAKLHHCSPQPSPESFKARLEDTNGKFSGRLVTVDDLRFEGGEDETDHSDDDSYDSALDELKESQDQLHIEDEEVVFDKQNPPTISHLMPTPIVCNLSSNSTAALSLSISPRRSSSIDHLEEMSTKSSSIFSRNGSRSSSATSAFSTSSSVSSGIGTQGTNAETQSPVVNMQRDLELLITMRIHTLELEQELRLTKENLNAKTLEASSLRAKYDKDFTMLRRANYDFLIELEMMEETCCEVNGQRQIMEREYRAGLPKLEASRAQKVVLEKEAAKMRVEISKLRVLTAKYEKQLEKAAKKDADKLAFELTKSKDLTQKLQGQLVTSESQRASLDHKLRNCVVESDALRAQKTILAQKVEALSTEVGQAATSVLELQREVASVEAERKILEDQLREVPAPPSPGRLQAEAENNTALTVQVTDQKLVIEKLQKRCDSQEKKFKPLEDQLRAVAGQREALKVELRNRDEKISLLEHQLRTTKDQQEDLSQKLEAQSSELKSYVMGSKKKYEQLSVENTRLRHQLVELDDERETQDLEIRILEDELCHFGDQSRRLEDEVTGLKSAHASQISSCERKERQKNMNLRRQLEALDEGRERQDLEIRFLKDELFDSRARNKELEQQVSVSNATGTSKSTPSLLKDSENTLSASPKEPSLLCQELCHILERRCVNLRADNRELFEDASNLRCQLAAAVNVQNDLRAQIRDHADEKEVLSLKLRHMMATPQGGIVSDVVSKTAYDRLQDLYQSLSKQYQDCEATVDELHDTLQEVVSHRSEIMPELSTVKRDQFKSAVHQKVIEELQSKIVELEKDREFNAPFVRCAIDARLGFLESARFVTHDTMAVTSGQTQEARINAKVASQCANGQLDAALFRAGLVPIDYLETANKVFKELYSVSPSRYEHWGPQAARVVDCQATLKSLTPSDRDGLSEDKMLEYHQLIQDLTNIRASVGDESFESTERIEELVTKLEYMTRMIVARSGTKHTYAS